MNKIVVKAFVEALATFHEDFKKFNDYFSDKRITQTEKKILRCWVLLKKSKYTEIIEIINSISSYYDDLVEAQKKLIYGFALNNSGEYRKAIENISKAEETIKRYPLLNQHFLIYFNSFVIYLNLNDIKGMSKMLKKLDRLELTKERQKVLRLQCHFNYSATVNEFKMAHEYLQELNLSRHSMSDFMHISFLVSCYTFYIKVQEFEKCEEVLGELKNFKNFKDSANSLYMKVMLHYFLYDKPIYIYSKDFKENMFLYHQAKLIQNFEEAQLQEAKKNWDALQKYSPLEFAPDYIYKGETCIFSLCLQKYFSKKKKSKLEIKISTSTEQGNISKEEVVWEILKNAKNPIHKNDLYFAVWDEKVTSSKDLEKLKKIISRLRKKKNVDIIYKSKCYSLTTIGGTFTKDSPQRLS